MILTPGRDRIFIIMRYKNNGIASDLCIRALDRSGEFGIYANELEGLAVRADKRQRLNRRSGA